MTALPSTSGPCILIGAGGHARVVAASVSSSNLIAVLDRDPGHIGQTLAGVTVTADDDTPQPQPLHIAIGDNATRRRIAETRDGQAFRTVIHPSALIAADVQIDPGAFIAMGAKVQTGVRLGAHAIVNTGAIIDHDCLIGAFSHVAPGAVLTGGVRVGQGVLIGAGAVVLPGLMIGDGATVGGGAVVTRPVPVGATVVGNPARPI